MKTLLKKILIPFLLIVSGISNAQKAKIDLDASSLTWLAKKVGGSHEGKITLKNGYFKLKKDEIISGKFQIDMNSITCTDIENKKWNQKLIDHLASDDFFAVKKFPKAIFEITKSSSFVNNKAKVKGKLTIKGISEIISFEINRLSKTNYTAQINVDRTKFGIKYGSDSFFDNLGDKVIENIFQVSLDLIIKK